MLLFDVEMRTTFHDVNAHANFDVGVRFIDALGIGEHGTQLHPHASHLRSPFINVAELSERAVGFDLVADARLGINVGQFAPGSVSWVLVWVVWIVGQPTELSGTKRQNGTLRWWTGV